MVIIALVVAGISIGAEMLHAAKIRSAVSDYNNYTRASNTFLLKYKYLPGDIPPRLVDKYKLYYDPNMPCLDSNGNNIVVFSNPDPVYPDGCISVNWPTTGNGKIDRLNEETHHFFQHLATAGLIEGNYHRSAYFTSTDDSLIWARSSLDTLFFPDNDELESGGTGKSAFILGISIRAIYEALNGNILGSIVDRFSPYDSYGMDEKLDDGLPKSGIMKAISTYRYFTRLSDGTAHDPGLLGTSELCCTGGAFCSAPNAEYDISLEKTGCTTMIVWGP